MMNELISVCIPTYNGEAFLEECLDSVVNQTYQNLEILIVDEGSTDGTLGIVKSFMKEDPRIRLIVNEHRLGLVPNWNKCLKESQGQWVKFQFQDDLMQPLALQKMITFANELNVGLVLTDRQYLCDNAERKEYFDQLLTLGKVHSKNQSLVESKEICKILLQSRLKPNFLGEPIAGLFHRSILNRYGFFDEKLKQIVDFEYWLRIASSESIGFLNEPLNIFRVHGQSVSSQNIKTQGPNPTYSDRILLIFDLLESVAYKNLRAIVGSKGIQELKLILTFYIRKVGFWKTVTQVDKRVLRYCYNIFFH